MVMLSFRADEFGVEPNRWIASLSDGTTIFEDRIPNLPSSWIRLKDYLKTNHLFVTRLRLQAYGTMVQLPPLRDDYGLIQFNGYWHAKRHDALMLSDSVYQALSYGIGFIKDNKIHIQWIKEDGTIEEEIRNYNKEKDLAGILNE